MTQSTIHKVFAPIKRVLPPFLSNLLRSTATAFLTPVFFSYRSGHFLSSFKMAAVTKEGDALPWYTYPCIDFLKYRSFEDKTVLEFGGGQSTLWWAKKAARVVTVEGDRGWYEKLRNKVPANVDLRFASMDSEAENVAAVRDIVASRKESSFDVIVIDGLYRAAMIEIAVRSMAQDGMIVCDNAEGYGIYEGFKERGLSRVDFYGYAPGVVLPHCTSVYFKAGSTYFDSHIPIHVPAND
jgi:hypothetical protein